ncbi:MAG: YdcF family protein, partial [Rhodoferax sp.]
LDQKLSLLPQPLGQRALATFRAAGWNVTPFPVDYRTGTRTPWTEYSMAKSLWRWQLALHEWAGLLAYRAVGRA